MTIYTGDLEPNYRIFHSILGLRIQLWGNLKLIIAHTRNGDKTALLNKQTKKNTLAQMKEQIEWCLIEEDIFYKNSFFGTFI